MKRTLLVASAIAAASMALWAAPASAQGPLPPYEIITSVRSMGLEPVTRPVRQAARYNFRAIDRRGAEVSVSADAFNGRIVSVTPLGYRPGPLYADRIYDDDYYPESPLPPRGISGPSPKEPSVIYGSVGDSRPVPPARVPSAVKPAPKVASKATRVARTPTPPPKPEPAEGISHDEPATTGAIPPPTPAESNPALSVPPVQGFD